LIYSLSFAAFSSISEGFFLVGSEGPASALAWPTAASVSTDYVSASVCIFEASAIFLEGVELQAFTVSSTSSTFTIIFLFGVAARLFLPSALLLLLKGLKFLTFFQFLAFWSYLYQSLPQLARLRVPSAW
jgi:hypothetical protein